MPTPNVPAPFQDVSSLTQEKSAAGSEIGPDAGRVSYSYDSCSCWTSSYFFRHKAGPFLWSLGFCTKHKSGGSQRLSPQPSLTRFGLAVKSRYPDSQGVTRILLHEQIKVAVEVFIYKLKFRLFIYCHHYT